MKNKSDIGKRLKIAVYEKFTNQSEAAKKMNLSATSLSRAIAKGQIGIDLLDNIVQGLPNLNTDWLLFGRGNMMLDETSSVVNEPVQGYETSKYTGQLKNENEHLKTEIEQLRGQVKFLQDLVNRLKC